MLGTAKHTASLTLYGRLIYYGFCLLIFEHLSTAEDDTGIHIPVRFTLGA